MRVPFVDLLQHHANIREEINGAIARIIDEGNFILGKNVRLFEEEFANYCGVKYGVGVASGTDALHLSLRACEVGPGDEVITSANTFYATVLAITMTGAKPVLVDNHPNTYTMDIEKLETVISEKTKAIIPVHLYGQMTTHIDRLLEISQRRGIWVIEDACQAHGAEYKGRKAGSWGELACFSFYPVKNLGALGDAGLVVSNNETIIMHLRQMRNLGEKQKYQHVLKGFNSRMDEIQAIILHVKLKYLNRWNKQRQRIARIYRDTLNPQVCQLPVEAEGCKHVYHLFVVRVKHRESLQQFLRQAGISTLIHYPYPIHLQQAFSDLGYKKGDFPIAEKYAEEILSLPLYPEMKEASAHYVAQKINEFYLT
ncbi:MAG: DegT/DnrJ/EryC1/StrS family aminotransferase [bacterium]